MRYIETKNYAGFKGRREDILCSISKKSFVEDVNLGIILGGKSLEREKCISGREGRINRSGTRKHRLCLHIVIYTNLASDQAFGIDYWKMRLENWLEPDGGSIEYLREYCH